MYIDEKRLVVLAEQVNAAFKASELAMEEMKKDIKELKDKLNAKKGK